MKPTLKRPEILAFNDEDSVESEDEKMFLAELKRVLEQAENEDEDDVLVEDEE